VLWQMLGDSQLTLPNRSLPRAWSEKHALFGEVVIISSALLWWLRSWLLRSVTRLRIEPTQRNCQQN
jgi:hypothetical protein